jgi:hypothetical protein
VIIPRCRDDQPAVLAPPPHPWPWLAASDARMRAAGKPAQRRPADLGIQSSFGVSMETGRPLGPCTVMIQTVPLTSMKVNVTAWGGSTRVAPSGGSLATSWVCADAGLAHTQLTVNRCATSVVTSAAAVL